MAIMRVKKNDTVLILSGRDKGKRGVVLEVKPQENRVKVRGIGIQTHYVKARRAGETSSMRKEEGYLDLSNVMPIDPATDKPCRINTKVIDGDKKVRVNNRSKEAF